MIIGILGQKRVGKDTAGAVIATELGGVTLAFADPIKRWCMLALKLNEEQLWGKDKEKPIKKSQLRAIEPKGPPRLMFHIEFPKTWSNYLADACCSENKTQRGIGRRLWSVRDWYVNDDVEQALWKWWNGLKTEPGLTPRRVMQHFGTEFVREQLGEGFWIDVAFYICDVLLKGGYRYSRTKGLIKDAAVNVNAAVLTDVRFRNEVLKLKRRGALVYGIERGFKFGLHPKSATSVKVKDGKKRTLLLTGHASEQEQLSVPPFWLDGRFINRFESKEKFEKAVKYVTHNKITTRSPVLY